jgi:hypothetical protein
MEFLCGVYLFYFVVLLILTSRIKFVTLFHHLLAEIKGYFATIFMVTFVGDGFHCNS